MSDEQRLKDNWLDEFKLVQRNPIYFLELYWNKLYPDEAVTLEDDEKQRLYDRYKMVPLLKSFDDAEQLIQAKKQPKNKGLKTGKLFCNHT